MLHPPSTNKLCKSKISWNNWKYQSGDCTMCAYWKGRAFHALENTEAPYILGSRGMARQNKQQITVKGDVQAHRRPVKNTLDLENSFAHNGLQPSHSPHPTVQESACTVLSLPQSFLNVTLCLPINRRGCKSLCQLHHCIINSMSCCKH